MRATLEAEEDDIEEELKIDRKEEVYQTKVIEEPSLLRILQPPETVIIVEFFEINLELQFSQNPFSDSSTFTCIKPSKSITY